MKVEYNETDITTCPVAGVQKIVRGKWTMVIIHFLSQSTLRFGELSRKMPQVTNLRRLDIAMYSCRVYP